VDELQAKRCADWLNGLHAFGGGTYDRAALACEVVRNCTDTTTEEYAAGVERFGTPTVADWVKALEMYGPVLSDDERAERGPRCVAAALAGDRRAMWAAIR
jgi:hypothetical protein